MGNKALFKAKKWIIISALILFAVGSILHFVYDIFFQCKVVGLFAPVNESVWEHSKLILWPVILWWTLYYYFKGRQNGIDKNKWFTGALVALLTALIAMPMLFYFYTGAFGVELLWVDILILLLVLLLGQLLGVHIYRHCEGINWKITIAVFVIIVLLFMIFTFYPIHIPIFKDAVTGGYGIKI